MASASPSSTSTSRHLPFLRSSAVSPSGSSPGTAATAEERDLAVAADGSYVETTSKAAARAMAKFYAQQAAGGTGGGGIGTGEGEEVEGSDREREHYGVQELERDGRVVYRIRPLAKPSTSPLTSPTTSSHHSGSSASSSQSGHLPFARPSAAPAFSPSPQPSPVKTSPLPAPPPAIELHRSSLTVRHSQSIPALRAPPSTSAAAAAAARKGSDGLLSPMSAAFPALSSPASSPDTSPLKRAGSSPSLCSSAFFPSPSHGSASVPNFAAAVPAVTSRRRSPAASKEGDVLGRILGWRAEVGRGTVGGIRDRREGSAGVPKVELSTGKGSEAGSAGPGNDRSDWPQDSVLEILDSTDESITAQHPFAIPQKRPSVAAGPFGEGVRIPRVKAGVNLAALAPPPMQFGRSAGREAIPGEEEIREMREVASNDSIRTARAADDVPSFASRRVLAPNLHYEPPQTPPPQSRRRRFEDPTVFDVFHRLSLPAAPAPSPCPDDFPYLSSAPSPSHPATSARPQVSHHHRLPSSASLASAASSTHSTTSSTSGSAGVADAHSITLAPAVGGVDDPRFCIWGTRDGPSTSTQQQQRKAPTSPPQSHTRRTSSAGVSSPSTPSRGYDPDLLRRQSIAEEGGTSYPPLSPSASSMTNSPAGSSRRWSISQRGGGGGQSSPATSVRDSFGSGGAQKEHPAQRILMAATVERLVAELTSQISGELLADFFLTYRHYLSPLDLLSLLLTRFDWAMSPPSAEVLASLSPAQVAEDAALRRVVRVRTFVVLRYWLMNSHFMEDFYPSREMRSTLTNWLNARSQADSPFRRDAKDMRLIKQLKKTVRRCKEVYVVGAMAAVQQEGGKSPALVQDEDVDLEEEGGVAANATASLSSPLSATSALPPATAGSFGFRARAKLLPSAFSSSSSTAPPPLPLASSTTTIDPFSHHRHSSSAGLSTASQNPIARSFSSAIGTFGRFRRKMAHRAAAGSGGGSDAGFAGGGERIGAAGRGELELEKNETGDLLWVKGGLDRYLAYWGIERPPEEGEEDEEGTPSLTADETPDLDLAEPGSGSSEDAVTPRPDLSPVTEPASTVEVVDGSVGLGLGLGIVASPDEAVGVVQPTASSDYSFPPPSVKSPAFAPFASPSTFFRPPIPIFDPASYHDDHDDNDSPPSPAPSYIFTLDPSLVGQSLRPRSTRIELDDLDSDEDDEDVIEATRTLKRLPAAHSLRAGEVHIPPHNLQRSAYRRSMDSELSYGFGSRASVGMGHGPGVLGAPWLGVGEEYPRNSIMYVDDEEGVEPGGVTVIPNFILDGLDNSDDEEPGDVEAALRRLEGLVDAAKEKEKKKRVERQMEKSVRLDEKRRRRMERVDRGEEVPVDEMEEGSEEGAPPSLGGSGSRRASLAPTLEEEEEGLGDVHEPVILRRKEPPREMVVVAPASAPVAAPSTPPTAPPTLTAHSPLKAPHVASPGQSIHHATAQATSSSSNSAVNASSAPSFRKASFSRIFGTRPLSTRPAPATHSISTAIGPPAAAPPPTHRSFLFFCRTEALAQQFTLIERDMLRMLSYQELVSGAWRERIRTGETDVLDWEAYLKERRRSDVLAKQRGETPNSAVQDIIARFNLTANWTASEILLTASIDERALLIAKFIRLAFKCYRIANLQTLTAIVHGLQIPDVERLKRTWAKVPAWEMRKYKGMQEFTSHLKNFKHLRDLTNALAGQYGSTSSSSSSGEALPADASKGCIPFLGIFLRDLALNAELPSFLDPTSPNTPASVSATGSLTTLADPSAFADYPPLPKGMDLAPLVNVHKFRILAGTVNRVIAFQELAARYAHEPTAEVYFKCLKIRCLDQAVMHELSSKLEA
ncbi:hypothetical protein JCM11251_007711 [Rhodosporidiobolus azoricus]